MAIYLGNKKVSVKGGFVPSSKALFNAGIKFRGGDRFTTTEGLIEYDDTSEVENFSEMFYVCRSLTKVTPFNTHNGRYFNKMFFTCAYLPSIDFNFDFTHAYEASDMFNACDRLTKVADILNSSKLKNTSQMFMQTSLKEAPNMDTHSVTNMNGMFALCGYLTSVPLYDMSSVTDATLMFESCESLTEIPAFVIPPNAATDEMFVGCSKLTAIHARGFTKSFGFRGCDLMSRDAILEVFNNLGQASTSGETVKMGATNLAKLTEEDKKIATDKGWTLK